MKNLPLLLLLFVFGGAVFLLKAAEPKTDVPIELESVEGELFVDLNTGLAIATNGIVVKYADIVLTAKKLRVNQTTGEAEAEGDVRIQREGQLWTGERIVYNFKTEQMSSDQFKASHSPFFVAGQGLHMDEATHTYSATNATVTTDDYAKPAYHVRAKRVTMVLGEYIEASSATLYLGTTPVFYFPYYKRSLRLEPNHFSFLPGYRSKFGPYLLGSYNWYWSQQLDGILHFDYRQKRGLGVGPEANYDLLQFGKGTFKYYYAHDDDPGDDPNGKAIPADRQRVYFTHSVTLRSNLTVTAVARYQSDPYIVRDFFESEYHQNTQPSSFLEIDKLGPNYGLNVLTQVRLNDFQETVERLPDIKLSTFRQQLGVSPLYYESESSFGYFRRRFPEPSDTNYAAIRADTYHQILLPWNFFGWLNVTPRVGGRLSYYGEADGPGATTSEETRGVFNTGAEVSTKASRVWRGTESKFLDVKGMRHIIEPSVNYVYVPQPHPQPNRLPQFDSELPSYRLLPIEYPDYNSIDSIDSQNVLRLSLRNKLQTKREVGIDNLVNWGLYTDWRINPRPDQSTFADIYSDLDFKPRSWLTFTSETRFRVQNGEFSEANHMMTIQPNNVWSWTLGHRYRRADPAFNVGTNIDVGNNLIVSRLFFRLNENWAASLSHHFEARDGTMEEQHYTLYRDMRSWTSALTLRIRDNRSGPTDVTVAVVFSLKAFPRFKLNDDINKPTLLMGG